MKSKINILVIGDSCIDEFIYGSVSRLAQEAPVPIINPIRTEVNGGMASNVHNNIKSLGVESTIITNVEVPIKTRYVDDRTKNIMFRVDINDKVSRISSETIYQIKSIIKNYDALIISDYDKGFLKEEDIEELSKLCKYTFLDTKKILGNWCVGVSFIKLNEFEYENNKNIIEGLGIKEKLLITLSGKGCKWNDNIFPVMDVETKNVSGAGDTFIASLVVKYLESKNLEESINFAQECATIVVQKHNVVLIGEYYGKN